MSEIKDIEVEELDESGNPKKVVKKGFSVSEDKTVKDSETNLVNFAGDKV